MKILVLPGDGIGSEITRSTLAVLEAADQRWSLGLAIEVRDIGLASLATEGTTLPDIVLERVPLADGIILGPVSHYSYPPEHEGGINPSARLRTQFSLGSNVRPCRSRAGLTKLKTPFDLIIVREATEGFYADRNMHSGVAEFMPDGDTALSLRKISAAASRRVARSAFELARARRRKVTAVHKANVLKLTDGLFLREVRGMAAHYPEVALDEFIVDAAAALLVRDPSRFDVIVTTNLFGDILSDQASELAGGLGLAGSLNIGDGICVAQAQHGSAPDIAGRGIANPASLIASTAMLLDWRGRLDGSERLRSAAGGIQDALDQALSNPVACTPDVGGSGSTSSFTRFLIAAMAA